MLAAVQDSLRITCTITMAWNTLWQEVTQIVVAMGGSPSTLHVNHDSGRMEPSEDCEAKGYNLKMRRKDTGARCVPMTYEAEF